MNYVKRRESSFKLNRENAIVNKISKGKIFEAELIAKRELVPKTTAVMQAYRQKQATESPIYKKMSEIADKPSFNYGRLTNAFVRAIKDVGEERDEEEQPRVEPPIEEIIEEPAPPLEPPAYHHKIGENIFMDLARIERLEDLSYDELDDYVRQYNNELYLFNHHMANTRVTDAMKQHGSYDRHYDALQNSLTYRRYLNDYLQYRRQTQDGGAIMTTLEDLVERFKVLYGEIMSGNKNKLLLNEFRDIIYYLFKNDLISKKSYNILMKESKP